MRVLQLISSLGFYGAENVLIELSKELKRSNIKLLVACLNNKQSPNIEVLEQGKKNNLDTEIINCDSQFDIKAICHIRKLIKKKKIDIIHSHNYKSNFYALIASLGTKIPIISTCHNWTGTSLKSVLYAYFDKFLLKFFNAIVAVSEPIKDKLIASGIPEKKIKIIQNGIDINRFIKIDKENFIRQEFNIPLESKVIGTIGRLSIEKGHQILLSAGKELVKKYPNILFLIVGDGPLKNNLCNLSKELPVIFTGVRKDIAQIYSTIDIFILPSLNEGLPMVLLEAMASKKVVIATDVGDIKKVIENKKNGLLINKNNKYEIIEAISFVIQNEKHAIKMSEEARNTICKKYSSFNMAHHYLKIYNNIVYNYSKGE